MRHAIYFAWMALAAPALAQTPAAPPAAIEPITEDRGIQLTPSGAALLSTAVTAVGTTAGLVWLLRGAPNDGTALGLLGAVVFAAPSAGRLAAGDAGGSLKHFALRAATAGAGALATYAVARSTHYYDAPPAAPIGVAILAGAILAGEAVWDLSSTSDDLSGMNLAGRRIAFSIAPLTGVTLLRSSGIPTVAPVLAGSPSAYALPGFGLRAAIEGRTLAAGILLQRASVTGYPLYDTQEPVICLGPPLCGQEPRYARSLKITSTRLLFTLDARWTLGAGSIGAFAAAGVGSTSGQLTARGRTTGSLATGFEEERAEVVFRLGPTVEWPIARYLSLHAEASLDPRVPAGQVGRLFFPDGEDAAIGMSVLVGVVARP